MDGSVSTLAPLFAAAFATHNTWATFLVGLAAAIGAGISMGFAEALSDDGSLTGRGAPLVRGTVCGSMTAIGGLGHTLPYLIPRFLRGHGAGIRGRRARTGRDLLDPHPLHGYAVPPSRLPGGSRRRAGFRRRYPHRQLLVPQRRACGSCCEGHNSRIIMPQCSCSPICPTCIWRTRRGCRACRQARTGHHQLAARPQIYPSPRDARRDHARPESASPPTTSPSPAIWSICRCRTNTRGRGGGSRPLGNARRTSP